MSYEDQYALSFQEVIEAGRDRARAGIERLAYMGARVIEKRGPLRESLTVADLCATTGLDPSRIKALCGQERFKGAKRGKGKGRPWQIPGELQRDGKYRPTLYQASKGPRLSERVENAVIVVLERGTDLKF